MREPSPAIALNYAPRLTSAARLWRVLKWGLVSVLLAGACVAFGPSLLIRAQCRYYQNKCMNYALPPGRIVLEEDSTRAQQLAAGKLYGPGWATGSDYGRVMNYYSVNPYWDKMISLATWTNILPQMGPLLFLYGRSANHGPERLVCVNLDPLMQIRASYSNVPAIDCIVTQPSMLLESPEILTRTNWKDYLLSGVSPFPLRFYAGQADETDSSHFSAQFVDADGWVTLNGWLQPDDSIKFSTHRVPNPTMRQ